MQKIKIFSHFFSDSSQMQKSNNNLNKKSKIKEIKNGKKNFQELSILSISQLCHSAAQLMIRNHQFEEKRKFKSYFLPSFLLHTNGYSSAVLMFTP